MKRFSLVALVFLAGCVAPKFDTNEFQMLAGIKVTSTDLIGQCPTMTAQIIHEKLTLPMFIAVEQVRHRTNAKVVLHADETLLNMIESFEKMHTIGPHPSLVYCQEKLTNIADGADRIMTGYAVVEK